MRTQGRYRWWVGLIAMLALLTAGAAVACGGSGDDDDDDDDEVATTDDDDDDAADGEVTPWWDAPTADATVEGYCYNGPYFGEVPPLREDYDGVPYGDKVANFTLKDIYGDEHELYELLKTKPVMLQFGAYTCGPTNRNLEEMRQLQEKYGKRADGAHIMMVYRWETHAYGPPNCQDGACLRIPYSFEPGCDFADPDYVENCDKILQPTTYEERVALATRMVEEKTKSDYLVLIDEMDNAVTCSLGDDTNSALLIGVDGRVVEYHTWFNREANMEDAIVDYLAFLWPEA